jgi:hypothetical protein
MEREIDIPLEMFLEEERKKCLKQLQNYYKKYGCKEIEQLKDYLHSLLEDPTTDIDEIKKQLDLLERYS